MSTIYLLDTNIIVHLVRSDAIGQRIQRDYSPALIAPRPLISIVSEGELRSLLTTDKDFDHLAPKFLNCEWIDPSEEHRQ